MYWNGYSLFVRLFFICGMEMTITNLELTFDRTNKGNNNCQKRAYGDYPFTLEMRAWSPSEALRMNEIYTRAGQIKYARFNECLHKRCVRCFLC